MEAHEVARATGDSVLKGRRSMKEMLSIRVVLVTVVLLPRKPAGKRWPPGQQRAWKRGQRCGTGYTRSPETPERHQG